MVRCSVLLCWVLGMTGTVLGQEKVAAPPLSKEQYTKIGELVRQTKDRTTALNTELDRLQQELMQLYRQFDLDEGAVKKVQEKIQNTQRGQMENFHAMQTELRKVVGKERFAVLNERVLNFLVPLNKPSPEKGTKRP